MNGATSLLRLGTVSDAQKATGRLAFFGLGIVVLVLLGNSSPTLYQLGTYTSVCVYLVLALSLNLIVGYLGILDFTAVVFYGFGAYVSVIVESRFGWSFWWGWIVSIAATVVLATITSMAMARLSRYFLTIASLALIIIGQQLASNLSWTGGGSGFVDIQSPLGGNQVAYFYLCGGVALLVMFLVANLMAARSGRAVRAVRDSDVATASVGINVWKYRGAVTLLSAALASTAGVLYAHQSMYISPDTFSTSLVILVVTAVVVGGLGSIRGTVIAAVLVVLVPSWFAGLGELAPLAYSVLVIVLLLFAPSGLAGVGNSIYRYALDRLRRRGVDLGADS